MDTPHTKLPARPALRTSVEIQQIQVSCPSSSAPSARLCCSLASHPPLKDVRAKLSKVDFLSNEKMIYNFKCKNCRFMSTVGTYYAPSKF